MAIRTIDRCTWCGRRFDRRGGRVELRAPAREEGDGHRQVEFVCTGCYESALHEPDFTPVQVWKNDDQRVVRLPDASYLGAESCRFATDP
jgi:hypothetical protein